MRFPVSSASLNLSETKPAIVQSAKRNYAWYKNEITRLETVVTRTAAEYRQTVKEFKESGTWKEEYKTWAAVCEHVLQISRRRADELISELTEYYDEDKGTPLPEHADKTDKKEQKALSQVEKAREPEPPKEEEEKPAVHSADEKKRDESKPHNNGHIAKAPMDVSGCVIPKHLLPVLERREEVREAMEWASNLKCLFERLQSESDPLFAHVKQAGSIQTFMTGAATMRHQLAECAPEVVCPECEGKSQSCHYCDGTGWICKVRWNRDWVKSNDRLKGAEVAKRAKNLT